MRQIILTLLFFSTATLAQEECDQEALSQQCYSQLCTTRTNIPDSAEGMIEDLAKNTVALPPDAISSISAQAEHLRSYLSKLTPAPESTYLAEVDRYIANPDLGATELTRMAQRLVGHDENGNKIYNDMLSAEETEKNTRLQNVIYGIFDRTPLRSIESSVKLNSPYLISEDELRQMTELASFFQTTDPARASAIVEVREALKKKSPVTAEAWQRADFLNSTDKYTADYFRTHRSEIGEAIKNYERLVVDRSGPQIDRALTNCQLVQYLGQKALAANNPQTLDRMARRVLSALESKFYPNLSVESAATLRLHLKPSSFELVNEKPDFSFFKPFENRATTRTGQILALDQIASSRCQLKNLSRDFTDDHGEASETGDTTMLISPLSLAQNAEAVLAHELGHSITSLMGSHPVSSPSAKKMAKLRSCLSSMHPSESRTAGPDVSSLPGDKFHTDEDFGDWMAGTLGFETDYLSCDLPRLYDIGQRATPVTLTAEENDPHSTDLFRLLHTRTLQGTSLPQVCRELIQQTPEVQPKKCEL